MPKNSPHRQRLLIVENQRTVREALYHFFSSRAEFDVVGAAGDETSALQLIRQTSPHLVLLDLVLNGLNGLRILQQSMGKKLRPKFLVLSDGLTASLLRDAIKDGADGVMTKTASLEELCHALNAMTAGRTLPMGDALLARLSRKNGEKVSPVGLTLRERVVLRLVAAGGSNKEIAHELKLSPFTVENHRAAIRRKLGLRTTQQLVIYAMQQGLLDVPMPEKRARDQS